MTNFRISTIVTPSGPHRVDIHDRVLVMDHEKRTATYQDREYKGMPDFNSADLIITREDHEAWVAGKTLYGDTLPWL